MVKSRKLDKFSMLMKKIQRAYDFRDNLRYYDRGIDREIFKPVKGLTDKRDNEIIVIRETK